MLLSSVSQFASDILSFRLTQIAFRTFPVAVMMDRTSSPAMIGFSFVVVVVADDW